MSARGSKEARLVLGASPRVDLLPPEVADRKKGAALRRSIALGVVGAVVLCAALFGFASWQSISATAKLDDARLITAQLLAEQAEYSEVRALSDQVATVTDARQVGATTEINWSAFYGTVNATLPAGMTITSFAIDSSSPIETVAAAVAPSRVTPVATMTIDVGTADFGSISTWLVALKNLPGYADATATTVGVTEGGLYTATVALNITETAYSKRFAPAETVAETPAPTTEESN